MAHLFMPDFIKRQVFVQVGVESKVNVSRNQVMHRLVNQFLHIDRKKYQTLLLLFNIHFMVINISILFGREVNLRAIKHQKSLFLKV